MMPKKIKREALVSDHSSRVFVVLYQDLIDKVAENRWYIFRNLSSRLYRDNFFLSTTMSTEITKIDDITDDVSDIMLTASLTTIHGSIVQVLGTEKTKCQCCDKNVQVIDLDALTIKCSN